LTPVPELSPVIEEVFVWRVASDAHGATRYRVDLSAYDGNGWCGCRGFEIKYLPKLERGERPKSVKDLKCKHLIKAHIAQSVAFVRAVMNERKKHRKAVKKTLSARHQGQS
jgi:hypothetical protein